MATTFVREKVAHPYRHVEYEIGDAKQAEFYPQFKTKHWSNQANFSVRLSEDIAGSSVETLGDRIIWKKGPLEAHFYEQDGDEDGQFEFEVLLKEKPKTNVLSFSVQSKQLRFLYQPELTPYQIAQGAIRPDNVVGSYAVYHASESNNRTGDFMYGTGKAFHIYRPHATDAVGQRVWCELQITDDTLTVTIPPSFVDTATYPVVVDPTFGYTSIGASTDANSSGNMRAIVIDMPDHGYAFKTTAYQYGTSGSGNAKNVLYATSANYPTTNLGVSAAGAITTTPAWKDLTFATTVDLAVGTYAIGLISDISNTIAYDTDNAIFSYGRTDTYATPANPYPISGSDLNRKYSVYATYSLINFTYLSTPQVSDGVDATSFSTSSWTPPNALIVLQVSHVRTASTSNQPTVTGNGITWTALDTQLTPNNNTRITTFVANGSGASAGSTTADFAGQTQRDCAMTFLRVDGADLSGGATGAIAQHPKNSASVVNTLSITLAAASNANNRAVAAFVNDTGVMSPRANWTEYYDYDGLIDHAQEDQYRIDAFETTASATAAGNSQWAGIALEIKVFAAAPFTKNVMTRQAPNRASTY